MPKAPAQTGDLNTEELDIEPELEADAVETDDLDTDVDTDDDPSAEDEPPAPRQRAVEETVPKHRFDEVNTRTRMLEQALEDLRQRVGQPAAQPQPRQAEVDPDEGLTPEAKNWAKFIRRAAQSEIDRRVTEEVGRVRQELIPMQRDSVVVKDMLDDQESRRTYRDYHLYEDQIKSLREQWYRDTGILVPRKMAYAFAKLDSGAMSAPTERTATARSKAKAGAQTQSRQPTRKVAPKQATTLEDVSRMSEADLEKALLAGNVTF